MFQNKTYSQSVQPSLASMAWILSVAHLSYFIENIYLCEFEKKNKTHNVISRSIPKCAHKNKYRQRHGHTNIQISLFSLRALLSFLAHAVDAFPFFLTLERSGYSNRWRVFCSSVSLLSLSLSQSKYFWYVGKCIPVNSNLSIDWMALGGCLQQKLSLWLLDPTTSSWRARKYLDTDGLRFGFSFIYRVVSFGFCSIRNSRIINSTSIYCLPIQSTHSDNYRQQDTRTLTAIDRIEYFLAIYFFRSFPDSHSVSFHMAQS